MVHELLGIRNGRVDMSGVPDIRPELSVRLGISDHIGPLILLSRSV